MNIRQHIRVCILGSGFGGVSVLTNLKRLTGGNRDIEITLISNKDHFLFTPLLHEAVIGEVSPEHIIFPIKKLQADLGNFNFINESILKLDLDNKTVKTESKSITYDYLVIATGSTTNYFGIKDFEQNAMPMKSVITSPA